MHDHEDTTRRALIRAGEKLFAVRAVGDVTEEEIVRQAGLGDPTAVARHFGDRVGLLRAIVDAHQIPVDARRNRLLDDLLRAGRPDPRSAVEVLVHPLADKLADPHGGREYLMLCARLRRDPEHFEMLLTGADGISRALEFVIPEGAPTEGETAFLRLQIISTLIVHGLADFARDERDDRGAYVRTLIDSICAVVAAPDPAVQPGLTPTPTGTGNGSDREPAPMTG